MADNPDNECGHTDCVDECAQAELIIVDQSGVPVKSAHLAIDDFAAIPVEYAAYRHQPLAAVLTCPPFIPMPRLAGTPVRRNDRLLIAPLFS